jgi:hypothetical protein
MPGSSSSEREDVSLFPHVVRVHDDHDAYVGGCPEKFISGVKYEEGDKVSIYHDVYVCREWPMSVWCRQIGYEPGGSYSEQAWYHLGYCEGKFTSVFGMKTCLCLFYIYCNDVKPIVTLILFRHDCSNHLPVL